MVPHALRCLCASLALLRLVSSLPAPYDRSELVNPSTDKALPSEVTTQLQDELSSIQLCDVGDTRLDPDHDVFIIPRSQITERTLNSLGYKDLVKYAKKFRYNNQIFKSHLDIIIPERTVPYFVFNTSDPLSVPKSQSRLEYANFLDHSAPFTLPELSALVDYLMLLPIPSHGGFDFDLLSSDVLTARSAKLPMFAHAMREGVPVIVFFFKSGVDAVESKEISIPLMNLKSIVTDHELNAFFDAFARTWVEDISMSLLVHGVFCTLNVAQKKHSYCLKIKDDLSNLALFPAYEHSLQKQVKRDSIGDDDSPYDLEKVLGVKKQVQKRSERPNAKMIPNANHNTEYEPIEELTIPLSIMREIQEESKDSYEPTTRKSLSTIQSSKDIQVDKKATLHRRQHQDHDDDEITKSRIEEIREHLEDRLYQKRIKDKKIRESANTFVKSKAEALLVDSSSTAGTTTTTTSRSRLKSSGRSAKDVGRKYRQTGTSYSQRRPSDGEDIAHEWNERVKQEKLNRANQVKVKSSASANGTSRGQQQPQPQPQDDCEPITWYGVFHHSIFGKTKFCGV